jgi:acylphosphatase
MKPCIKCLISGRVQGVFFRASAHTEATRLGITGHAINLPDGRVEVLACGERVALEAMKCWLASGPPGASVDRVECQPVCGEIPTGFSVR